jgi:hypothetical protein
LDKESRREMTEPAVSEFSLFMVSSFAWIDAGCIIRCLPWGSFDFGEEVE